MKDFLVPNKIATPTRNVSQIGPTIFNLYSRPRPWNNPTTRPWKQSSCVHFWKTLKSGNESLKSLWAVRRASLSTTTRCRGCVCYGDNIRYRPVFWYCVYRTSCLNQPFILSQYPVWMSCTYSESSEGCWRSCMAPTCLCMVQGGVYTYKYWFRLVYMYI